jgi:hypothetical protein
MPFGSTVINSVPCARDTMSTLGTALTGAGFSFVETYATPGASTGWSLVAYGNSTYVAVANGTYTAATSPDGATWTKRLLPVTATWTQLIYGGGLFLLLSNGPYALTSPDGVTWSLITFPTPGSWFAAWGNNQFVAVCQSTSVAMTSPDGVAWTQRQLPFSATWQQMAYGAGVFVVANNSSNWITSPDGITWSIRSSGFAQTITGLAYANNLFVAVTSSTAQYVTSPDGVAWTVRSYSPTGVGAVAYGAALWVVVATSANYYTSPDAITWTLQTTFPVSPSTPKLIFGGSQFVEIGNGQAVGATSSNGLAWTQQTLPGTSSTPTADVYKSPAASNVFGSDWYLILRRASDTGNSVFYQVAEGYDIVNHKISNYGGTGQSVIPTATTYTNPAAAAAPDAAGSFGANAFLNVISAQPFSLLWSITPDRVVIASRVAGIEYSAYAGLYEDLLPTGTSKFPLFCAKTYQAQGNTGSPGSGVVNVSGGFTREPLQASASTANFEAIIATGWQSAIAAAVASGLTPMSTPFALYGNGNAPSRVLVGSARSTTYLGDAIRGLLIGCVCSALPSITGDTLTVGGRTYVRMAGPTVTFGIFVDQGL